MSNRKYSSQFIVIARIIIIILIIGGAVLISKALIATTPKTPQRPRQERTTIATTIPLEKSDKQIFISTTGLITPKQTLNIYPQVTGKVIEMSESFEPGSFIKKGENIIKVDPADYEIALIGAEAAYTEAKYNYDLELGYQGVAKHEWELFDDKDNLTELEQNLMLRVPHLKNAKAKLKSAEASLEKAELDLARTEIQSPFNSIVLSRNVALGTLVSSQTTIGTIVDADSFRAEATIPVEELKWIKTAQSSKTPAKAWISLSGKSYGDITWEGTVQDVMSEVESGGRKAKLLIDIPQPFNKDVPLLLNSFVNILIEGPTLENVFVVPACAIRSGTQIWLKNSENRLEVKDINIVWRDSSSAIISNGENMAGQLVISSISSPVPGMKLSTKKEQIKKQMSANQKQPAKPEEK